ncbi:hypothetical protein H2203_007851 [Taxawa tesnikishii (nom. ined.)]|nr:hypothetical protein H2203_007851 [Dothideales sp. JES 119]
MVNQTESNYNATQNNQNLSPGDPPLEKDFSNNGYHLDGAMDSEQALHRIRTAGSISISPELFEKIYLSPQNNVKGDLRKTLGNPTPLQHPLVQSPLTLDQFILGNTFPFVVFGSFGAFWLTFAGTLQPFYNAYGAYSTDVNNPAEGLTAVGFNASFAFFQLFMGLLCLVYFICSLRTNITFAIIFLTLIPAFGCFAGAYWQLANGNAALAGKLIVTAGALTFITDLAGWWIFFAIMLAALDFPIQLPVGDLSGLIKGATEKKKLRDEEYNAAH